MKRRRSAAAAPVGGRQVLRDCTAGGPTASEAGSVHLFPWATRIFASAMRWLFVLGFCAAASCSDVQVVAVEIAFIELEPPSSSILIGESVQVQARLLDRSGNVLNGHDIAWSSSNPAAVAVNGTGLVQGIAAGSATITAATGSRRATAQIAVNRPAPGLISVQPSTAQRLQSLDLVLSGSKFQNGATAVNLGDGITIDAVSVTTPESIAFRVTILPGAELGARDISVTTQPPGGGTATLPGGFTVLAEHPAPALTIVSPATGQREEVLQVTLGGTGFIQDVTTVSLGADITVDALEVLTPSSLKANIRIGAGAALGPRDVFVSNPAPGGGSAVLAGGFNVQPQNPVPSITSATPSAAQRREILDVTLTGSGFIHNLTTVTFGPDITVNAVQVNSLSSLTANIRIGGAASLGSRSVSATNGAPGGGTGILANGFTILEENPAPSVTMALPDVAPRGVTLDVILLGSGFVQGLTSVSFGEGITVNSVNVIFWTSLVANITIAADAAAGPRNVSVTNAGPGGGTFTMNEGFMVTSAAG